MTDERQWVETVRSDIEGLLAIPNLEIETSHKLPYAFRVDRYQRNGPKLAGSKPVPAKAPEYQTDLLIAEYMDDGAWLPRVVVEFKLGKVTTHDSLTYSTKASTHKNVHPYLRYGIVIGSFEKSLPGRLTSHGHHFDFMMTLASERLSTTDRDQLISVLSEEVKASQDLSKVLAGKSGFRLLHRKLFVS